MKTNFKIFVNNENQTRDIINQIIAQNKFTALNTIAAVLKKIAKYNEVTIMDYVIGDIKTHSELKKYLSQYVNEEGIVTDLFAKKIVSDVETMVKIVHTGTTLNEFQIETNLSLSEKYSSICETYTGEAEKYEVTGIITFVPIFQKGKTPSKYYKLYTNTQNGKQITLDEKTVKYVTQEQTIAKPITITKTIEIELLETNSEFDHLSEAFREPFAEMLQNGYLLRNSVLAMEMVIVEKRGNSELSKKRYPLYCKLLEASSKGNYETGEMLSKIEHI